MKTLRCEGEIKELLGWVSDLTGEFAALIREENELSSILSCNIERIVLRTSGDSGWEASGQIFASAGHELESRRKAMRDRILRIVRLIRPNEVWIIIGGGGTDNAGFRRVRGSLVLQPRRVFEEHEAAWDAIEDLESDGISPRFGIALAGAFHEGDYALLREWSDNRRNSSRTLQKSQFELTGFIDSCHSAIFYLSYPLIFSTAQMQPEVGASLRQFSHDES